MAAVSEETTTVNEVECEKAVEELKPIDDTAAKTEKEPEDSEPNKSDDQSETTNGLTKDEGKDDDKGEEEKKSEEDNAIKTDESNEDGKDKSKDENDQKSEDKALGTVVAKHYNEHPEGTKESRKESRIFYMRNFNNWVKSVIINDFLTKVKRFNYRNIHVLDLCCGKGGDLLKWQRGRIRKLVCADIAKVSVDQCKERYKEMKKTAEERRYNDQLFYSQFIVADCSKERLAEMYEHKDLVFDLTSCQFSFHYSFESYEQADMMLKNACERLKPGGYFVGTTTNAYELVKRVKQADGLEFGNDVYKIAFENKDSFPLYGCKYHFKLDGVVDCPEFLLYFPVLEKMAKKYSMKLEYAKPFHEFFNERIDENMALIPRMNALETYPVRHEGEKLVSPSEDSYSHAKDFLQGLQSGKTESSTSRYRDHRERNDNFVRTMSKEEWEAVGMYIAFAFVKVDKIDDDEPPKKHKASSETTESTAAEGSAQQEVAPESRKRRHDAEDTTDEPPAKKLDEQPETPPDEPEPQEMEQVETQPEEAQKDETQTDETQPDKTTQDETQPSDAEQNKDVENVE